MITIGMVIEGKYDFPLLEACLGAELSRLGYGELRFRNLQPELDATGELEAGGWTKVVGWLANFSGGAISTFLTPLFDSTDACDLIIVHIDADVRSQVYRSISATIDPSDDITLMASEIENELRRLLDAGVLDPKVRFAVPVFKSENWLMTGASICADDRWTQVDAKRELRTLYDQATHGSIGGMKELMLDEISNSTDLLYSRAKSYRPLRDGLPLAFG